MDFNIVTPCNRSAAWGCYLSLLPQRTCCPLPSYSKRLAVRQQNFDLFSMFIWLFLWK